MDFKDQIKQLGDRGEGLAYFNFFKGEQNQPVVADICTSATPKQTKEPIFA